MHNARDINSDGHVYFIRMHIIIIKEEYRDTTKYLLNKIMTHTVIKNTEYRTIICSLLLLVFLGKHIIGCMLCHSFFYKNRIVIDSRAWMYK